MLFFRYEDSKGDGPFCTRDGILKNYPNEKFNDNTLSGVETIEGLKEWFSSRNIKLSEDYLIHIYRGDLIHYNSKTKEVIVKKDSAEDLGVIF